MLLPCYRVSPSTQPPSPQEIFIYLCNCRLAALASVTPSAASGPSFWAEQQPKPTSSPVNLGPTPSLSLQGVEGKACQALRAVRQQVTATNVVDAPMLPPDTSQLPGRSPKWLSPQPPVPDLCPFPLANRGAETQINQADGFWLKGGLISTIHKDDPLAKFAHHQPSSNRGDILESRESFFKTAGDSVGKFELQELDKLVGRR